MIGGSNAAFKEGPSALAFARPHVVSSGSVYEYWSNRCPFFFARFPQETPCRTRIKSNLRDDVLLRRVWK